MMLHTLSANAPDWPRVMLADGWVTLTHKMGSCGAPAAGLITAVSVASVVPLAEGEPVVDEAEPVLVDGEFELAEFAEPVADEGAVEEGACEDGGLEDGGDEEGGCEDPVLGEGLDGGGDESEVLEDAWLRAWQFEAEAGAAALAGASVTA